MIVRVYDAMTTLSKTGLTWSDLMAREARGEFPKCHDQLGGFRGDLFDADKVDEWLAANTK
ncbi:MAG TPA: hypothetical protein VHZ30_02985 [Verrucomicrobiae bacterium]|nr:hypothetical protein [Verrucomicrobiae bacterium]